MKFIIKLKITILLKIHFASMLLKINLKLSPSLTTDSFNRKVKNRCSVNIASISREERCGFILFINKLNKAQLSHFCDIENMLFVCFLLFMLGGFMIKTFKRSGSRTHTGRKETSQKK
jgi:hypothetical protein